MTTIPSSPAACLPLPRAHRSPKWRPRLTLAPGLCGSLAAALTCTAQAGRASTVGGPLNEIRRGFYATAKWEF